MPGDATHIKWAWGTITFGAAVMYYLGVDLATIVICAALVMFFTMYWSPDIDVTCKSYYRWKLARVFLLPFVKIFSHRGVSHHIILGPTVLTIYFVIVLGVLNWIFMRLWLPIILPVIGRAQDIHHQITTLSMTADTIYMIVMVVGCLWYAAWTHYLADYTTKGERGA